MTAQTWQPDRPYNQLPLLPPTTDLETRAVLRQCIAARAAMGELKQAARLIPNQGMLISTLPVLEARASSEIENIVTTTDKLFRTIGGDEKADPATKEALRYSRALFDGHRSLQDHPLSTRTAERICTAIKGIEMNVRKVPGTALVNAISNDIVYTPPEGETLLRDLLANWERYIHADDGLDPLIRLAVAHYQFEAIHPFTDGNGRTGRILNSLFLTSKDLLTLPILYLSRYINKNRADYYRLLQDVTRDQAWEPWLIYILKGIEETALWTTAKISAINALSEDTAAYLRQRLPKIYSRELLDLLFRLPYCRIVDLTANGIAKRQTASIYLNELVVAGVLQEVETGRKKLFVQPKLIDLLSLESNAFQQYGA
jgi:Fic family protein